MTSRSLGGANLDLDSLSSHLTIEALPAMSLTLKHLHLNPTLISSIEPPEEQGEFRRSLLEEALELLDSELWTDRKEHHGGLVETFGFPVSQVKYEIDGQATMSPTGVTKFPLVTASTVLTDA